MQLRHEQIDGRIPTERLVFCHTADLTGNGRPDVIVGGKGKKEKLQLFGKGTRFPNYTRVVLEELGLRRGNVFWYENPGWERHRLTDRRFFEVGSAMGDITGDGRLELVAGQTVHRNGVYWYEQPADPREEWTEHLLTDAYEMYHDVGVADVDDDGEPEVVLLSQESAVISYYDVPPDPRDGPWGDDYHHVVDDDRSVEGLAVVDWDDDGRSELIAGTAAYHRTPDGWRREPLVEGWDPVRTAVADLDDDGRPEIVFAEGDSPAHGTHLGRVAVVDPDGSVSFLAQELFCPHSLGVADVTRTGTLDVVVGEMGLDTNEDPRLLLFENRGDRFVDHLLWEGIPTHEAKVVDLTGDGRLDIVGKPYGPGRHVDVWYNEP